MENADEMTGDLSDRFGVLEGAQQVVGKGFDKVNAKAGFMGTAMTFVQAGIMALVTSFGSLAAIITGTVVAAIVALLALSPDFRKGFIQGIKDGLSDLWEAAKTTADVIIGAVNAIGAIFAPVVGPILEHLGSLNERFKILEGLGYAVGKALVYIAGAVVVVKAIGVIIGIISTLVGVFGTVVSVVGTVLGAIGTLISIFTTVVSVVATVIAALNPITLVILAIVAVLATLYVAWKNNWFGIRDIVGGVVDWMSEKIQGFVNWIVKIPAKIRDAFAGVGKGIKNAFPDLGGGGGGMTFGGVTLPSLDTGGIVERSGTAVVHEGEAVIPADVSRNMGLKGSGSGGEMKKVEVNVGGIEIGDQTLDLSKMRRSDLRTLAEEIAAVLGDEVRNTIS